MASLFRGKENGGDGRKRVLLIMTDVLINPVFLVMDQREALKRLMLLGLKICKFVDHSAVTN